MNSRRFIVAIIDHLVGTAGKATFFGAGAISLNRTLYERARDIGGYRMTSSAVAMSQDDWKRHYGPAWQTVQAAKTKFDPKNVLTPGHGMFPS